MGKKLVEKIDRIVASLRDELDRNDGSTLQAVYSNVKKIGVNLTGAIKAGDRKLSSKILNGLGRKLEKYKKEDNPDRKEACQNNEADQPETPVKPEAKTASRAKAAKPKPRLRAKPKAGKAEGAEHE